MVDVDNLLMPILIELYSIFYSYPNIYSPLKEGVGKK